MVLKVFLLLVLLLVGGAAGTHDHKSKNGSHLAGIEFPEHPSFNAVTTSATTGCSIPNSKKSNPSPDEEFDDRDDGVNDDDDEAEDDDGNVKQTVMLNLKRMSVGTEKEHQNRVSKLQKKQSKSQVAPPAAAPKSSASVFSESPTCSLQR